MLFDLKGKRRRTVQGVYLMLAVLMGVGLVAFGIGSGVNGGLSDLFGGSNGSNKGNEVIQKKIDTAEKQLQANPTSAAALGEVIRGHYQLATVNSSATGQFTKDAGDDLREAATAWERYIAANPKKPDLGLARVMVQAYSGLAQIPGGEQTAVTRYWGGAASAVELIASAKPTPDNYIALVQYATLAGQTRKADLAGKKAVSLAPKKQRKAVEQKVAATKASAQSQAGGSGAGAATGTAP
jgi:hypothetical protein